MAEICILTPEPGHYERTDGPRADYRRLFGEHLDFRSWSDPGDLSAFRLIMPLLAWGYHQRAADWFAALERWDNLPFANPVAMLRWNTDKHYLLDLEAHGVPIVPVIASSALSVDDLAAARQRFGNEQLIVKPAISGGADRTYRLSAGDPIPSDVQACAMLVQPLMSVVAAEGEFSLFYFDASLSHAIIKRPAVGDFRVQEQFGGTETAIDAPALATDVARAALAACRATPLYARVDLVRAADGGFQLMELELIEPSLFLDHAPDGGAMFAEAVMRRLNRL